MTKLDIVKVRTSADLVKATIEYYALVCSNSKLELKIFVNKLDEILAEFKKEHTELLF
jgi:translation elongation factor EF-G